MDDEKLIVDLIKHIEWCEYMGHSSSCASIRGPGNEWWIEPEKCDCGLNELKDRVRQRLLKEGY